MTENTPNTPEETNDVSMSEASSPNPANGGKAEDVEASADSLTALRSERDSFKDRWLRSQAELDNFRKRTQRETEQERLYYSLGLTRDLLPAFDNLTRAVEAAKSTTSSSDVIQGVSMVLQQIDEVLKRHSIQSIDPVGQVFDPNLHEAIQMAPSTEVPANVVMQEVQRGYKLHERVIRPSMVIVSSGPPQS